MGDPKLEVVKLWNDTSPIEVDELEGWYHDDALWMVTCSCIIFNMQTGFGMLESGCVSLKNEVNIMMKNMVDVVLGGMTYWAFGYGMSYGESSMTNWFMGFGDWFVDDEGVRIGPTFTGFIFQMSFATTATTIVSGAIAERFDFNAYCIFSLVNTIVYCVPAGWLWAPRGFLYQLGCVDIAGSGGVHLVGNGNLKIALVLETSFCVNQFIKTLFCVIVRTLGGASALVSAWLVGPRLGRWELTEAPPMGSPTNALIGLYMLWWGWLAFNAGSTFG